MKRLMGVEGTKAEPMALALHANLSACLPTH